MMIGLIENYKRIYGHENDETFPKLLLQHKSLKDSLHDKLNLDNNRYGTQNKLRYNYSTNYSKETHHYIKKRIVFTL